MNSDSNNPFNFKGPFSPGGCYVQGCEPGVSECPQCRLKSLEKLVAELQKRNDTQAENYQKLSNQKVDLEKKLVKLPARYEAAAILEKKLEASEACNKAANTLIAQLRSNAAKLENQFELYKKNKETETARHTESCKEFNDLIIRNSFNFEKLKENLHEKGVHVTPWFIDAAGKCLNHWNIELPDSVEISCARQKELISKANEDARRYKQLWEAEVSAHFVTQRKLTKTTQVLKDAYEFFSKN